MKRICALAFLAVSISVSATTVKNDAVLSKANDDYNRSVAQLGEKEKECSAAEVVLPADSFSNLKLSKDELNVALRYHHFKSHYQCTAEAVKEYLVSSALLAALVEKERAQNIYESSELIVDTKLRLLKTETEYEQLSDSVRESLSKLEVLQKPFKLIESADALGF